MAEDNEHDPGAVQGAAGRLGAMGVAIVAVWHRTLSAIVSFLTRVAVIVLRATRAWAAQWPRVAQYHGDPSTAWSAEGERVRETAAAAGVRAFVFGVVVASVIEAASRNAVAAGVGVAVVEVLWAGARFIIIALLVPRGTIDRQRLSVAYLAGLLPYALGVTLPLRIAALFASAVLTHRGLLAGGMARSDASRAVAWSFGGQAAAVAAGWLARALLALSAL